MSTGISAGVDDYLVSLPFIAMIHILIVKLKIISYTFNHIFMQHQQDHRKQQNNTAFQLYNDSTCMHTHIKLTPYSYPKYHDHILMHYQHH